MPVNPDQCLGTVCPARLVTRDYDSTTVYSLFLLRIPYFLLHFHATVLQVVGSATTTIFDHMNFCGAARDRTRDKPLAYFQLAYILRQVECRTCYPFGHRACSAKLGLMVHLFIGHACNHSANLA